MRADSEQRAAASDPHDFASLYIRHRSSFAAQARRNLTDARDVEEVVQEAFLRLFLALPELDTELQALAYCRRTVTNLCIDRYRADARRPRMVDLDAVVGLATSEEDADDSVIRAEDAAIVRDALARLTPAHRAALVKHEMEEKSIRTVARELGVPESTVKHLLYRARRALRQLLAGTVVEPGVDVELADRIPSQRRPGSVAVKAGLALAVVVALVTGLDVMSALGPGPARPVLAAPDRDADALSNARPESSPATATVPAGASGAARTASRPVAAASAQARGAFPAYATPVPLAGPRRSSGSGQPPSTGGTAPTSEGSSTPMPFLLSGSLDEAEGRLTVQQRQLIGHDQLASRSRFQALTRAGEFLLDQRLTFALGAGAPTVAEASLSALIPSYDGASTFSAATATVSLVADAGGPVSVRVEGQVRQTSFHAPGLEVGVATIVVETDFAPDLVSMTAQRVSLILVTTPPMTAGPIAEDSAGTSSGRPGSGEGGVLNPPMRRVVRHH